MLGFVDLVGEKPLGDASLGHDSAVERFPPVRNRTWGEVIWKEYGTWTHDTYSWKARFLCALVV